ncbi:hypothetical protein [Cyanobium sp. WAJ14-Wanaka]
MAAGIFCGCYPFFGLQIVLGVGLASSLLGGWLYWQWLEWAHRRQKPL